jgi:non-ribosomal peptide synthetase component F
MSVDLLAGLRQVSHDRGVTLYMTLLSAFAVLLGGRTTDREVAIGSPVSNRARPELELLVGYFVNTLVMRLDIASDRAFAALLAQTREVTASGHQSKDLPFRELVRDLVPVADPAYTPITQVMFNLVPTTASPFAPTGGVEEDTEIQVTPLPADAGPARYDLNLALQETESGLTGQLGYSTDLFSDSTADDIVRAYERLLWQVVADPEAALDVLRSRAEQVHPAIGGETR